MKSEINYLKGDATQSISSGKKIIVHICNDIGAWGKGFVLAISKRWPEPEKQYKEWYKSKKDFSLGEVQFVQVEPNLWVANMIGQHNIYKDKSGNPPIRYDAVLECLSIVSSFAMEKEASTHMPRIGCGLAGGKWDKIEPLIKETLISKAISITVYDFN